MWFQPTADENYATKALSRFIDFVGIDCWCERLNDLASWVSSNPLYQELVDDRHGIETAFAELAEIQAAAGCLPFPPRTLNHYRFYNLSMMAVAIHDRLSAAGRNRLAGTIRGHLKSEFGLGPLAFEMKMAAHLMGRGFDVDFVDLEGRERFDFLATKNNVALEVECKHISADIGRQVHRRKLLDLGILLLKALDQALARNKGAILVRIRLPGRLTNTIEHQADISRTVLSAVVKEGPATGASCNASFERLDISDEHPIITAPEQATRRDLTSVFGPIADLEHRNVIFHISPKRSVTALLVESDKPDKVLKDIVLTLKGAAKAQFSQQRPALLCAHFSDLTGSQLRELGQTPSEESPLMLGVSHLIDRRPWLHTVALTATGAVTEDRGQNGDVISVGQTDISFVVYNHHHRDANSTALRNIFTVR